MKKILLFSFAIIINYSVFSQKIIEFTVGVGYTPVDVEEIVLIDEVAHTEAEDWGLLNGGFSGQFSYGFTDIIGLGLEFSYHHLYWYSVRVPYGVYDIFREYSINTTKLIPYIRFGVNSPLSLDVGSEFNFMDGNTELGLLLSANYYIGLSEKFAIPVKFRFELIDYYLQVLTPISLHTGIQYKF